MSKPLFHPKQSLAPRRKSKGDQRLSQTGNSDLQNKCKVVHTLYLPQQRVSWDATWSRAEPQAATLCHLQAGVVEGSRGSVTSHFPFHQFQVGLAALFRAHQQFPAPCLTQPLFPSY